MRTIKLKPVNNLATVTCFLFNNSNMNHKFTPMFKTGARIIPITMAVSARKPSFSASSNTTKRLINKQIRKKILQINANRERKEKPVITNSLYFR